jgi:hypothetical protein
VTENLEGARRIAERASRLLGGSAFEEVSPESFIDAVFGVAGFGEKTSALAYLFWWNIIRQKSNNKGISISAARLSSLHYVHINQYYQSTNMVRITAFQRDEIWKSINADKARCLKKYGLLSLSSGRLLSRILSRGNPG